MGAVRTGAWNDVRASAPSVTSSVVQAVVGVGFVVAYLLGGAFLAVPGWVVLVVLLAGYPVYRGVWWHGVLSDAEVQARQGRRGTAVARGVWVGVSAVVSLGLLARVGAAFTASVSGSVVAGVLMVLAGVAVAVLLRAYRNLHQYWFAADADAYWPVFTDLLGRLPLVYAVVGGIGQFWPARFAGVAATPLSATIGALPVWRWLALVTPVLMLGLAGAGVVWHRRAEGPRVSPARVTPLWRVGAVLARAWEVLRDWRSRAGDAPPVRDEAATPAGADAGSQGRTDGGDASSWSEMTPPEIDGAWLPLTETVDGVEVEKTYASAASVPVVKFTLESQRSEPVHVRLREPVPVEFSLDRVQPITDHEAFASTATWSKHPMGSYLECRGTVAPGEALVTGFGLETEAADRVEQFLREPPRVVDVTTRSEASGVGAGDAAEQRGESGPGTGASGGAGGGSRGESAHPLIESAPPVAFDAVAGRDDMKQELREEVIAPLENPAFERYDVGKVNGVLLYGPPGTGKTYLAEALAGELGYHFMPLATTDVVSSTVGEGVEQLGEYFAAAREHTPCVMFFDEIDALAADRTGAPMTQHQKQVVNTLLERVAEINENDEDVLVVAATNRPETLDDALQRTGRFDTTIKVGMPDGNTRVAILEHHLETRGPPTGEFLLDAEFLEAFVEETAGLAASAVTEIAEAAQRAAIRESDGEPRVRAVHVWDALAGVQDKHEQDVVGEFITEPPEIDFDDVGGMDEVKARFEDTILQALAAPERYEEYGLDPPTGVLLYGPPGTGKTYLSKAVAGEAEVTFLSVSGADITSKWVGEGAENVRDLIEHAKAVQPCLLFVDELDAIAGQRSQQMTQSEAGLVNELLTGLSDLDDEDVIVIATTNRPDQLDDAVKRSGRMDERIEISPPDGEARVEILKVHLRDRPVEMADIEWDEIRARTAPEHQAAPLVASDLESIVDEAAREAMQEATAEELQPITQRHLIAAIDAIEPSLATASAW